MTQSQLFVVAANASKLDGHNASMFVCDEVHEHHDGSVFNVLQSSCGMRKQPLGVCITTAGFNTSSFCYQMRQTCVDILKGNIEDDSQFAIIFTLDDGDDAECEENWVKSSPNLGVTVRKEYIRQQALQAKNNPTLLTSYLTKLQNLWLSSAEEWLPQKAIMDCQRTFTWEEVREDLFAYLGVDLGATNDLTCMSVMVPSDDKYYFRNYYYLPHDVLTTHPNRELYNVWQQNGYLTITPGNVTDYDYILTDLLKVVAELNVVQVAFDQWNATQFQVIATEQAVNMVPYSMSIGSLNRPTKELARLILSGKVVMYKNPIDRFCFKNVVIKRDFNDNERPTKQTWNDKIDGVMAMCMALGGYLNSNHFDASITTFSF